MTAPTPGIILKFEPYKESRELRAAHAASSSCPVSWKGLFFGVELDAKEMVVFTSKPRCDGRWPRTVLVLNVPAAYCRPSIEVAPAMEEFKDIPVSNPFDSNETLVSIAAMNCRSDQAVRMLAANPATRLRPFKGIGPTSPAVSRARELSLTLEVMLKLDIPSTSVAGAVRAFSIVAHAWGSLEWLHFISGGTIVPKAAFNAARVGLPFFWLQVCKSLNALDVERGTSLRRTVFMMDVDGEVVVCRAKVSKNTSASPVLKAVQFLEGKRNVDAKI